MKTLITPSEVVRLAFAEGMYLTPDAIAPADIAAAERRYLIPVTGQTLYDKLLTGAYPELRAETAPALALCTRLVVQPRLDVRTGRCGTTAPRTESSQPASESTLHSLRQSLRRQSRDLLRGLSEYLAAHSTQYREYDSRQDIFNRCTTDGGIVQIH